ncbi:MAG: capsule biosynthesis protein CapA [Pseudomonadota bacterium]
MAKSRVFLFLQGPHGPFFRQLATALSAAGARCFRVGLNRSDQLFWGREDYIPFGGPPGDWEEWLSGIVAAEGVSDIVLYGDTRPVHATALRLARRSAVTPHVFEEGYLRPWWITYERGGTSGNSRCLDVSLDAMTRALGHAPGPVQDVPATWGELPQHIFWGAAYHAPLLRRSSTYPHHQGHRDIPVTSEFGLYARRLALMAPHAVERFLASRRVRHGGFHYHLVLLQLSHDPSFRLHGPFPDQQGFLETVLEGFRDGAPDDHRLVFKAHPLEDGRTPVAAIVRRHSRALGIGDRVHFVRGGKLATLLDRAETAITVNSTSAHQALFRGLPVRTFGASVYARRGITSRQSLPAFFAAPEPPDPERYGILRSFLLATTQVQGGYYATKGRRRLLQNIRERVLSDRDPYDLLDTAIAANPQQARSD